MPGWAASLRRKVTDANCYLGSHTQAYDHAFCAKLRAAAGSPLVFCFRPCEQVYIVVSERSAVRLPKRFSIELGFPGWWSGQCV